MEIKVSSLKGKCKSEKGLGLVDTMVGIFLMGLIGIFLMSSLRTFIIGAKSSGDRTQALFLAQQVLEEFKKNDGNATQEWDYESPDPKYVINITIPEIDSGGLTNLVPCKVTVTWNTPRGTQSISLVSYYYK